MIVFDQLTELAPALAKAQADFSAVPKGSVNPFFKSKYAALPDVVQHAGPVLAKHGLAISQFITYGDTDELTTILLHTSGQYIVGTMRLHLVKDDPQAQGSAVTYARRYAYMSALGLVADDDDDGNSASKRSAPKPAAKPTAHQRIGAILAEKVPADSRKLWVTDTIGRETSWAEVTETELATIELALATL